MLKICLRDRPGIFKAPGGWVSKKMKIKTVANCVPTDSRVNMCILAAGGKREGDGASTCIITSDGGGDWLTTGTVVFICSFGCFLAHLCGQV